MDIGITGNRGFIARHLSQHLNATGHQVHNLDPALAHESCELPERLDAVFHLAASSNIQGAFDNPSSVLKNNLESLLQALQISKEKGGRFIFFSSYVYGHPTSSPITEDHPRNSLNPYMGSKLIGEDLAKEFCQWSEMELVILRPFSIYGEGMRPGRLIGDLINQVREEKPIHLRSPEPVRDYLHVEDLCQLCSNILETTLAPNTDPAFNVGSGFQCSNLELAELIHSLAGLTTKIKVDHVDRKGDVFEVIPALEKVTKTFSWKPKIGLEEGLKRMLGKP